MKGRVLPLRGHVLCFFFSSRRRHTRCLSDWSSDVCSSDLWESASFAMRRPAVRFRSAPPLSEPKTPDFRLFRRSSGLYKESHAEPNRLPNPDDPRHLQKIGRASCRERVYITMVALTIKKKG